MESPMCGVPADKKRELIFVYREIREDLIVMVFVWITAKILNYPQELSVTDGKEEQKESLTIPFSLIRSDVRGVWASIFTNPSRQKQNVSFVCRLCLHTDE